MSGDIAVSYEALTQHWIRDIHEEAKGTETLDILSANLGSRQEAIAAIVDVTASGHFDGTRGEVTQQLARWNSYVRNRCSERFENLVGPGKNKKTREQANADPLLYDLNGIRMGVQRALAREHGFSRNRRRYLAELNAQPTTIDPQFFESIA